MGKPINENPNPAPRMNAPAVQLNPSSEIAALRAKLARAHAEIRLWREWAGDVLTGWPCVNGQPITAAVDAHRDLEGGGI